jgi:hypothetical protein
VSKSKKLKEMERMHLLATVVAYPGLSTQGVRDRANSEAQHDDFDPLPFIQPQGITGKLNALSIDRLVTGWQDIDVVRWDPTEKGRQVWAEYENGLNAPSDAHRERSAPQEHRSVSEEER